MTVARTVFQHAERKPGNAGHDSRRSCTALHHHITARIPGKKDHLLINLYGLLYKEITASGLVTMDVEGKIVWKPERRTHGWPRLVECIMNGDSGIR